MTNKELSDWLETNFNYEIKKAEVAEASVDKLTQRAYRDGEVAGLTYAVWCHVELNEPYEGIKARLQELLEELGKGRDK